MNKNIINHISICAVLCAALVSCTKENTSPFGGNTLLKGPAMIPNVPENEAFVETKAGDEAGILTRVFGDDGDGFTISEYVADIDAIIPATKGTEMKQPSGSSGNFNIANREFMVKAFLDSLDSDNLPIEHINEFNLSSKYSGSAWNWTSTPDPCWRTSTTYSMWSYWPVDAEGRTSPGVSGWEDGEYQSISFHYQVPGALENQNDLLFAYNEEKRDFVTDENGNYPIDPVTKKPVFNFVEGQTQFFDVHFYHALAAVKFELNVTDGPTKAGADVHSITLCYIDPATKKIVTTAGIVTEGDCVATGNCTAGASGEVSFAWSDLSARKPLHYEFADLNSKDPDYVAGNTIKGGYAKDGNGVLFMIPQDVEEISVIVEFSKYGGKQYYTKVKKIDNVTWKAGKYYTYRLSIGEFHVPGEIIYGTNSLYMEKFQGGENRLVLNSKLPIKDVLKVGMYLSSTPSIKVNKDGVMVLMAERNGVLSSTLAKTIILTPSTTFSYNFQDIDSRLLNNNADQTVIYGFGLNDSSPETYKSYDYYELDKSNFPQYYVYDTDGWTSFNLGMHVESGNNGNNITLNIKGIMVLEVRQDPNLPVDFEGFDWSSFE